MSERRFPYEKIAKLESEQRRASEPADAMAALIADIVGRPDPVVLDVGVGTGYYAIPTARALPAARVIGFDVEPRMLEAFVERVEAAGVGDQVTTSIGAVDAAAGLPFEDDSVDIALMASLYHELDDRPRALAELRRVLRPGGKLLISDWDPAGSTEHGPPAYHRVAPEVVEAELRASGFFFVERRDLYENHYLFIGE
jgi:ubiquinone/menaquinone biosynthesis C-methylase UbiE